MLSPVAGPSYPSEPLVTVAGALLAAWLLGVVGVYDAGRFVHMLLAGAIVSAVLAFTRAR
jgi:Family of unknown function (DUF5670)